jgi:nicotinate-nucleotide adenylyltransferase
MRYALLGGSFNPVHIGHLALAQAALEAGWDRVIFVPAFISPFKQEHDIADSSEDRINKLLAAIAGERRFTVDDCEIKRQGVSYTVDTVKDIAGRYLPDGRLGLLIGDDLAEGFPSWHGADEILKMADIVIAHREGAEKKTHPYPCILLDNSIVDASSSEIRKKSAAGEDCTSLLPKAPSTREAALENIVRGRIPQSRFLHSRSVALDCVDLASRVGVDQDKAWTAGITHDACKALSNDEMKAEALKDGAPLTAAEIEKPALLHGRAAAIWLAEEMHIKDQDIINAVRWHTTGRVGATPLEKIVYIADKIEPRRTTVKTELRMDAKAARKPEDLAPLFVKIVKGTVEWLREQGRTVDDASLAILREAGLA